MAQVPATAAINEFRDALITLIKNDAHKVDLFYSEQHPRLPPLVRSIKNAIILINKLFTKGI